MSRFIPLARILKILRSVTVNDTRFTLSRRIGKVDRPRLILGTCSIQVIVDIVVTGATKGFGAFPERFCEIRIREERNSDLPSVKR